MRIFLTGEKKAILTLLFILSAINFLGACGDNVTPSANQPTSGTGTPSGNFAITLEPSPTPFTLSPDQAIFTEGGTFSGTLETYQKVFESTKKIGSYKFTISSKGYSLEGVFVKPDKLAGKMDNNGQKTSVILIGKDFYFSLDNKSWQKVAEGTNPDQLTTKAAEVFPKNLNGAIYSALPDEKMEGKEVGVFTIDTTTVKATLPADVAGSKFTFKYDKLSLIVIQAQITNPSATIDIRYTDFDNPVNKVEAPL